MLQPLVQQRYCQGQEGYKICHYWQSLKKTALQSHFHAKSGAKATDEGPILSADMSEGSFQCVVLLFGEILNDATAVLNLWHPDKHEVFCLSTQPHTNDHYTSSIAARRVPVALLYRSRNEKRQHEKNANCGTAITPVHLGKKECDASN